MKNNLLKIAGIVICVVALGLNLQNALTGHGIKGNKDLNPEVLADGSSGSGSNTGSGECTSSWPGDCIQTGNHIYYSWNDWTDIEFLNPRTVGKIKCWDVKEWGVTKCDTGGSSECTPGKLTYKTYQHCGPIM